jgi:hypothetical protein
MPRAFARSIHEYERAEESAVKRGLVRRLALVTVLAVPASAAAKVRLISVTSPVRHGTNATLSVSLTQPGTCSITVYNQTGASGAQGLYPKRGSQISWTWKVDPGTKTGWWPIVLSCGSAGTLQASFVVS